MADIRTITILPTPAVASVQQSQGSGGAGAQGSAILANLTPGTILNGFIVNRDALGNPILRTDSGDINFSSNFFLNIGSEVSIRVENSVAGTLAHILTVNGQPPEIATTQSAFSQEPNVIVSENLSNPANPASLSQAQAASSATEVPQPATTITITGTLVAQPQQPANNTQPPLPTGTQVTLKVTGLTAAPPPIPEEILSSSTPQTSPAVTPPTNTAFYTTYARAAGNPAPAPALAPALSAPIPVSPPAAATRALPEVPAPQAAAAPSIPANVPTIPATPATITAAPSTTVTAAPLPATAPATASEINTTPPVPQPSQSITAMVIGNKASGETSLQTPLGVIRLQPSVTLPTGSIVTFEVTDTVLPPAQTVAATLAASAVPAPLTELAQQWTSLQQIFSLLAGRDGTSSFNAIQDTIPWVATPPTAAAQTAVTPQNIPAGLMVFMAALRGGNFSNWLGEDNVKWLQDQGHDSLVSKANSEFTLLARQFTETAPQHWQPLFFPIAVGGELQQARLFVKRDRKQGSTPQGKKNEDTRFVVEVDLTQLGEIQMDGFVRQRDQSVQFDMVIRSLTPLSNKIQQDIMQIYNSTGELTGYKGSLSFQTVKDFPVNPMEEIVGHTGAVVA